MKVRVELDEQVAAGEMNGHRAVAPAVDNRCARDGASARARGERLPRATLPDAGRRLGARVDPHELDIRALGEAWVVLDQRPEAQDLVACGIAGDHGVGIPDRDRCEL
jgi:hypothetical protein